MSGEANRSSAVVGRNVERGGTYLHEEHGTIEVTHIWRGTQSVDRLATSSHEQCVVIRYAPVEDSTRTADSADTLGDFLTAIE